MALQDPIVSGPPFYVLLGGDEPGIYETDRPANTALGKYRHLVPIVVCCASLKDAEAVQRLNGELFMLVDPTDAYTMLQYIHYDQGPARKIRLQSPGPYYAIRYGSETGVYIGYSWHEISHLVDTQKDSYKKFDELYGALDFMLNKPGFNRPMLKRDEKLPPPDTPRPVPQCARPAPAKPERSPSPTKLSSRRARPASVKPERSPSPTKLSSGKRVAIAIPPNASTTASAPPTPSRARSHSILRRTPSDFEGSASGRPTSVTLEDDNDNVNVNVSFNDFDADNTLYMHSSGSAVSVDANGDEEAWHILRRVIRMPGSMMDVNSDYALPVNLGPEAERLILSSGGTTEDVWKILQIRAHTDSAENFTFHMGLVLEWPTRRSLQLWHAIKFPRVQ